MMPQPTRTPSRCWSTWCRSDPNYAPAWEELGLRYYYDSTYSDGGEDMFQRSTRLTSARLELDPNRIVAAGQLITNRVERGELGKAYEAAQALVKSRPESAQAHFVMAYVYRYAGMLEQSAKECDTALALDPGNYIFRSCAWAFMELGKTERAADFIRLDAGSEWAAYVTPSLLLREGKIAETKEAMQADAHCSSLSPRSTGGLSAAPAAFGTGPRLPMRRIISLPVEPDPEMLYYQGALLGYCGKNQAALRLLQGAVEQNYCAYSNLLSDPMLGKLRADPEFNKVLTSARECQEAINAPNASQEK